LLLFGVSVMLLFSTGYLLAQDYVGSQVYMGCHNTDNATLGYDIWEMYMKSGHP